MMANRGDFDFHPSPNRNFLLVPCVGAHPDRKKNLRVYSQLVVLVVRGPGFRLFGGRAEVVGFLPRNGALPLVVFFSPFLPFLFFFILKTSDL